MLQCPVLLAKIIFKLEEQKVSMSKFSKKRRKAKSKS